MRRSLPSLVVAIGAVSSCTPASTTPPSSTNAPIVALSTTIPAPTVVAPLPTEPTSTTTTTTIPVPTSSMYASWSEVVAAQQNGVVRLRATSCDGLTSGFGSGFFVGSGLVVTAAHVVNGYGSFLIDRSDNDPLQQTATLIGINVAEDVALLSTVDIAGFHFSFEDVPPLAGADIGLIGFSGGRVPARPVRGTVNQLDLPSASYGDAGEYHPSRLLSHDLPTNGGDSGAPLLDPVTGDVVAINVASDRELAGVKFGIYPAAAEALIAQSPAGGTIDQCAAIPVAPTTLPTATAPPSSAPPVTRPTTTVPTPGGLRYEVLLGDTLFGIARAFNTTLEAILAVNGLTTTDVIYERDIIVLPVGARPLTRDDVVTVSYTVRAGDTIIGIARSTGTTPAQLLTINQKLAAPNDLRIGEVLLIPRFG